MKIKKLCKDFAEIAKSWIKNYTILHYYTILIWLWE